MANMLALTFFFFNDTATTEIYTFPTRRSSDLRSPACVAHIATVIALNVGKPKPKSQLTRERMSLSQQRRWARATEVKAATLQNAEAEAANNIAMWQWIVSADEPVREQIVA